MARRAPAEAMPSGAPGRRRAAARGFTLVELLVVIAVIGAAVTAVVLTLPDPRGNLVAEAETLAARLAAARDAAIMGRRSVALRIDAQGYQFEQRAAAGWTALPGRAFAAHAWPAGATVELTPPGLERVRFDATGLATPATIQLLRDGAMAAVTVDAAGAIGVETGR